MKLVSDNSTGSGRHELVAGGVARRRLAADGSNSSGSILRFIRRTGTSDEAGARSSVLAGLTQSSERFNGVPGVDWRSDRERRSVHTRGDRLGCIVAAAVLSPGREEHTAMLAGEGRHKEAIALLERRLAKAPSDPDLLAALGRSRGRARRNPWRSDAFDACLAVRPDDLRLAKREAELLLQSGLIDRYLDALARVVAAEPSPGRVTRLVELFRLYGRVEDEMATLADLCRQGNVGGVSTRTFGGVFR